MYTQDIRFFGALPSFFPFRLPTTLHGEAAEVDSLTAARGGRADRRLALGDVPEVRDYADAACVDRHDCWVLVGVGEVLADVLHHQLVGVALHVRVYEGCSPPSSLVSNSSLFHLPTFPPLLLLLLRVSFSST